MTTWFDHLILTTWFDRSAPRAAAAEHRAGGAGGGDGALWAGRARRQDPPGEGRVGRTSVVIVTFMITVVVVFVFVVVVFVVVVVVVVFVVVVRRSATSRPARRGPQACARACVRRGACARAR